MTQGLRVSYTFDLSLKTETRNRRKCTVNIMNCDVHSHVLPCASTYLFLDIWDHFFLFLIYTCSENGTDVNTPQSSGRILSLFNSITNLSCGKCLWSLHPFDFIIRQSDLLSSHRPHKMTRQTTFVPWAFSLTHVPYVNETT